MRINLCTSPNPKNLLLYCLLTLWGTVASAQTVISGRITLEDGVTALSGIPVEMTGTENEITLTDNNGNYNFSATPGGSYQIRPYKEVDALNGVSTLDAVLIMRHVLGVQQLNSPYQLIAADVDNSGTLTVNDSIILRSFILGILNSFPSGESWRFVPSSHVFPDPLQPFPFPTVINLDNIAGSQINVNFIGVKLGDVNNTALLGGNPSNPYFSRVTGKALYDENNNCAHDPLEKPLIDWLVVASGFAGEYVGNTNGDGSYTIFLPEGDFTVSLINPNGLWNVCTPAQAIQVGTMDTITRNFSAQADILCPRLEVDLAAGFLRRCFSSYYRVQYCNRGTLDAENAYVEVTLDDFISLENSSISWSSVSGNTYTFPVGNVGVGECSNFFIEVLISCDAELGQTHCSAAHIFPDSLCGDVSSLWNGANLRVSGACNGSEVEFTVTNTGEAMTEAVDYVIIEDIMIQMDDPIILGADASQTFSVPANGSTWRLEVDQPANHPLSLRASAAVEGCGVNPGGTASQGIVTLFPQDDEAFFIDEDCQENIGSFDPNDKQGFPRGVGAEHFIPKGEEIEYLIRFQNTGTDTAFTVMILDTLSGLFDLATLRPGASSHPYTFKLLGQGVAQFVFSNIMLPDSNVNEAASHGFVKLTIAPKTGLPDNTQLENHADIYFDFNEPVITNRTLHTIGEQYLEVSLVQNLQADVSLHVFPNPARSEATFQLQSPRSLDGTLLLYDLQGREVKRIPFSNNTFKMNVSNLPGGQYFFRLEAGGQGISSGKISIEK